MYKRQVLDNGLRIVSEKISYVKSVSVGIWIGAGVANETAEESGISHFIEHMLFKGTQTRSAKKIAEEIDGIGGQLNAFTGKECTCYYAKTLDSHTDHVFEVLSDMLFSSNLSNKDIETERNVISEEIRMYEDSPEELVHDLLAETVWHDNALGYPILGTYESLRKINRQLILEYIQKWYSPQNTVISVAGSFDSDNLQELIYKYFGSWKKTKIADEQINHISFNSEITFKHKDTEQIHMCIGFNGLKHCDDRLYALFVANNIIGGGVSSRLFQKIREDKGLVYSIYSYPSSYKDVGMFTIYAGMNPEHVKTVTELLLTELKTIVKNKFTEEEVNKAKEQLKGAYILGLESTSSRMTSIGKSELLLRKIYSPDEIVNKIEKVSMNDVAEIIENVFNNQPPALSVVGTTKTRIDFARLLKLK